MVISGGMPIARHAVLQGMMSRLDGDDIGRCRPFGAVNDVEADPLALLQAFEALGLDGGMVHKDIFAPILLDKTESL